MTLFFPSCLRASVPASVTRPMKINSALHINTANIKRRSREQRTRAALRRGQLPPRWVQTATLRPQCYNQLGAGSGTAPTSGESRLSQKPARTPPAPEQPRGLSWLGATRAGRLRRPDQAEQHNLGLLGAFFRDFRGSLALRIAATWLQDQLLAGQRAASCLWEGLEPTAGTKGQLQQKGTSCLQQPAPLKPTVLKDQVTP